MRLGTWLVVTGTLCVSLWSATPSHGQVGKPREPAAAPDGAQLYRTWCASCHGLTGQGNGPLAPMLKRMPPDLTVIASRNSGIFPTARIRRVVDGREVESHGDPDMPIWGAAFRTSEEGLSAEAVKARIDAIVAFLESIQKRNAQ